MFNVLSFVVQWSMVNGQRPTFSKNSAISHFRQTCPESTVLFVILQLRFRDISSLYLHEAQHSLMVIPYGFLVKFDSMIFLLVITFYISSLSYCLFKEQRKRLRFSAL